MSKHTAQAIHVSNSIVLKFFCTHTHPYGKRFPSKWRTNISNLRNRMRMKFQWKISIFTLKQIEFVLWNLERLIFNEFEGNSIDEKVGNCFVYKGRIEPIKINSFRNIVRKCLLSEKSEIGTYGLASFYYILDSDFNWIEWYIFYHSLSLSYFFFQCILVDFKNEVRSYRCCGSCLHWNCGRSRRWR